MRYIPAPRRLRAPRGLALGLVLIGLAGVAPAADLGKTERAVLEKANVFRQAQKLPALSENDALAQAARRFARYMAKTGRYGHTADGRQPSERVAEQGYEYCIIAENIAYRYRSTGYDSAEELASGFVEGWKNSPGHREKMLSEAVTETGVGLARDPSGRYFAVQLFALPEKAAIQFEVSNQAGRRIEYRLSERRFSLAPGVRRTHTACRPGSLFITPPSKGEAIAATPEDGMRYSVFPEEIGVGPH